MRKVLIVKNIHKSGLQLLNTKKDFSYEVIENLETNFLKNKLKDCDAVSLRTSNFTKELIESAPKLKIISRHGVGYDNIDLDEAKKKKNHSFDNVKLFSINSSRTCFFYDAKHF